jgi:hypothetical protein
MYTVCTTLFYMAVSRTPKLYYIELLQMAVCVPFVVVTGPRNRYIFNSMLLPVNFPGTSVYTHNIHKL